MKNSSLFRYFIICVCCSVAFSFVVLRPVFAAPASESSKKVSSNKQNKAKQTKKPEKKASNSDKSTPSKQNVSTRNSLGVFSDWQAYYYQENGQMVCYMVTLAPKKNNRNSYLMLTHRPFEGELNTFNYNADTALSSRDHASISIDNTVFNLFALKENAWAKDSVIDKKIAGFLSSGQNASVKALTAKKSNINDKFSLKGSMAAYEAISKKCQVNVKYASPKVSSVKNTDKKVIVKK